MQKILPYGIAGAVVAIASLVGGYQLGAVARDGAPAAAATAAISPELGESIRNYLMQNPELIAEMQTALEDKQREEQRLASLDTIKNASVAIFNAPTDAVVGNPQGKTTIVEFYDYNCGFCRRAIDDMRALTSADPDLRFVLKELPILGPDSQKAHIVSQAFHRLMPEKYAEFHNRLLGGSGGRATEASAILVATSLGVDEAALRAEMKKPEVIEALQKNFELADRLQITGTPSYVIGDEVIFGALGQQVLTDKIASARAQCQTAAC
ncbi:MAG: DsbA family protein [Rhizobiaceae bacterium]|nr:DsbA family protein [Rhizobiaceae bacterium]